MFAEGIAQVLAPKTKVSRRRAPWREGREAIRDASGGSVANGTGMGNSTIEFMPLRPDEDHAGLAICAPALRMPKILLPVDFSECSQRVVHQAAVVARLFSSELTVLHVSQSFQQQPPQRRNIGGRFESHQNYSQGTREQLECFGGKTLTDLRLNRVLLRDNDPARAILEFAHRERMDLIVMPTYGTSPFHKLILGSVAETVSQKADCPVWTCAHAQERLRVDWNAIRSVVCAVDFESETRTVLAWARDFTRTVGATLTVVHAISPFHHGSESYWSEDLRRDGEAELNHKLLELGLQANIHVEMGEVTPVVTSIAENLDADLLAIGRTTNNVRPGSIVTNSYSLIQHSNCPVVSV